MAFMTRFRTAPPPQNIIIGVFVFLAAVLLAVAPIPILYRSLGILLAAYVAFSAGGMPFAYLVALLAPPVGLITGDNSWLIMLPIILSTNLLAMLGLEYAWRYPALVVSPLLGLMPSLIASQLANRELFYVELPWNPAPSSWTGLHALIAFAGVLLVLYIDRRREELEGEKEEE